MTSSVQQKAVPIHLLIIHCIISLQYSQNINDRIICRYFLSVAHRAGSDDSMSASGSADPGFHLRRGSKFSFEKFQPRG